MNADQINNITAIFEEIESLKINDRIAHLYPDRDLTTMVWYDVSLAELPTLTSRVVFQFRGQLESGNFKYLPNYFAAELPGQSYQPRDIMSVLRNFCSYIQVPNWDPAILSLKLLIIYQIQNGFWDRRSKFILGTNILRREKLIRELETRQSQADALREKMAHLLGELQNSVNSIEETKADVANLLASAQKNRDEIASLVAQATGHEGKLGQMLETQSQNLAQSDQDLKQVTAALASSTEKANQLNSLLKEAEMKIAFIKEKEAFVNKLAGTAGAALLGFKFEERKVSLGNSSKYWLRLFVLSLILAGAWLWLTHTYFHVSGANIWLELASNFGLLLPALFLVLFVAAQYAKERHYEEEYAFRSSVAMTMTAFADELESGDTERNKLIAEAVQKLYRLPSGLEPRAEKASWFGGAGNKKAIKEILELIKQINETKH